MMQSSPDITINKFLSVYFFYTFNFYNKNIYSYYIEMENISLCGKTFKTSERKIKHQSHCSKCNREKIKLTPSEPVKQQIDTTEFINNNFSEFILGNENTKKTEEDNNNDHSEFINKLKPIEETIDREKNNCLERFNI